MPLVRGQRELRIRAQVGSKNEVTAILGRVILNMDAIVRDDILGTVNAELQDEAVKNIREGAEKSHTPPTHRLEKSIRSKISKGDVLNVSVGENLPYAVMHNKPIGSTTLIVPINRKSLRFRNFRSNGEVVYAKFARRPGTAFFGRAILTIEKRMPKIAAEAIKRYVEDSTEDAFVIGKGGARVQRFGSLGIKGAQAMGLVRKSDYGSRKDMILTEKGKEYVKARQRGKKASLRKSGGKG